MGAAATEDAIAVFVSERPPGTRAPLVELGALVALAMLVELGPVLSAVLIELGALVELALEFALSAGLLRRKRETSERAASASGRIKR